MYKIRTIILFTLLFSFLAALPLYGGWLPWSSPTLVSIGDEEYSNDDFQTWWKNWQEEDMELPQSPAPFIEWILLSKEAERMKLYESPGYQKKVITFLKARTLMYLKAEEIDTKIKISDQDLWNQYQDTHAPQYQLNIFFFKQLETAQAFVDKLGKEPLSDEEFSSRHGEEDGYFTQRNELYRPRAINPGWLPILHDLEKGKMSQPVPLKTDFVVLRLQNTIEGTRNDFATIKKQLRELVWKKEETRLTAELLTRLRKQYHVTVDKERLNKLDVDAPNDTLSNEPLIYTDNGNIPEKIVIAKIRQIRRFRIQNGFKIENDFQFNNQVVYGIIDQTLTSWEALARHYEKKPPLEATYTFYCQHRMISLLEEKIFAPQVKVDEEEIKDYYQKNIILFTQPEVIRMAIIEGDAKALNSLWLETALGGDFIHLAQQRIGHEVPIRDIPANHLHAQVRVIVDKLTKNEVSRPFLVDGHMSLVQLLERKPEIVFPLSESKNDIQQALYTLQLEGVRQGYLDKLRMQYTVDINDKVWQNLKTKMEQDD